MTVGRDPHLDLSLSSGDVSRLHLIATVVDGTVVIEDLGSTNGTFIDRHRISPRASLPVGSVLRVGDHVFRCERCSRREMQRAVQEHSDLERAANYVRSLLAPPLSDGPLQTEWMFKPSSRLGGDAFGYERAQAHVPDGSRLYLFSDGIFEIVTKDGPGCLDDFVALVCQPLVAGTSECQRLYRSAKTACHPGRFEDDVSLLIVTFP